MLNSNTGRRYSSQSPMISAALLLSLSELIARNFSAAPVSRADLSSGWLFFGCLLLASCTEERPETSAVGGPQFEGTSQAEVVKLAGAPLFEGMSEYSYPISSQVPHVQRYFDQGLVLAFAFNHAESIPASARPKSSILIVRFASGARLWLPDPTST